MYFSYPANREGGSNSHHNHHQDESDPKDSMKDSKLCRFDSMKRLFRSQTTDRPSSSKSEPQSNSERSHSRQNSSSPGASQEQHEQAPPPEPSTPATPKTPLPGTRGLFVPAYSRSPEHFAQRLRRNNPTLPLPVDNEQPYNSASQVIVRFFNCENLNFGREPLTSPDLKRLLSSAVAFLGECQISDTPQSLLPRIPNPGYRGLTLESSHGGYHIHFPDCAGPRPLFSDVSADWDKIMQIHAQDFPDNVLLVGVGLGEPGPHCR